jgi:outer membrane protein TolC
MFSAVQSKRLMDLTLWSILTVALTFTSIAAAQTTNHQIRALSLKECLQLALAHNLDIQIDRYSPQISQYLLNAAYGAYDPTLNLTAQRSFVDEPAQFNPKKYPLPEEIKQQSVRINSEYELTVDSVGPALGGHLPSGLSYNLFARSDHLNATTFPSAQDLALAAGMLALPPAQTNDYYATAGITLSQPLLKNAWIDIRRRNIQINKQNLKISELALKANIMTILTSVITSYYDLVFAREQVNVEKKALELAGRLLEDTRLKVKAGTMTPLDETQAEADVETIRTALFAAEQNYSQRENILKNLLTEQYQSWMDVGILPSETLSVPDLPANRTVSWVNALTKRPDLEELRLDLERQNILVRFSYNQLFPNLDLFGSYGWQAVERGFSGSWNTISDGSNPFYSVGVVFSIPLGNITARNEYKASQAARKMAMLRLQQLQNTIFTEVDTAVKLVETTYKQISSTHKAGEAAEAALEARVMEFNAGTTNSFFVLEAQRNLIRARSAEIRALADYNIALAKLALSEGTTLEKNQITLKTK